MPRSAPTPAAPTRTPPTGPRRRARANAGVPVPRARAVKRRRGRPRDEALPARRREEILAAATLFFARRGFRTAELQELADTLGLAKGTLYRYFPSKAELFFAAADRVMTLLHQRVSRAADEAMPQGPLSSLHAAIREYLTVFGEHPEFAEMLIIERAVFKDRKHHTYFVHRARNVERWRSLFARMIQAGVLRPLDPAKLSDVLGQAVYGAMFTNVFAGRRPPPEEQAADILDFFLRGALATAPTDSHFKVINP